MKEVRVGIIGLGRGRVFFRYQKKDRRYRIVALCDRFETRLKAAYEEAKDPDIRCYTDHHKMLKEAKVDAVAIAVAPEDNVNMVCEVLEAGKHVLCEVPLAYTIEDCWRVVLAVEKSGLKFQMADQVRYMAFVQAWRKMVQDGTLGKIVFAEGQYLHGMGANRFWQDKETGRLLTPEEAQNNPRAEKTRVWNLTHPILYLPHELSPILHILDDRVVKVTCMSTRRQSYLYEWFPRPDIEVALMHTAKDTILRVAAGFTIHTIQKLSMHSYHWYHMLGTKGTVETNRANCDKMKLWLVDSHMSDPAEVMWQTAPNDMPEPGGMDHRPIETFVESIVKDSPPHMDVYAVAESAAPAIIAAQSAEEDGRPIAVPDFRPGPARRPGQEPAVGS